MHKAKGDVHAEEDARSKKNLGDWCQVPASVCDLPNPHTTLSPNTCMCLNHTEYVSMMTKQVLNTCPDEKQMDDDVNGTEEDYVIASKHESRLDDVEYSEEFNDDDVVSCAYFHESYYPNVMTFLLTRISPSMKLNFSALRNWSKTHLPSGCCVILM